EDDERWRHAPRRRAEQCCNDEAARPTAVHRLPVKRARRRESPRRAPRCSSRGPPRGPSRRAYRIPRRFSRASTNVVGDEAKVGHKKRWSATMRKRILAWSLLIAACGNGTSDAGGSPDGSTPADGNPPDGSTD